MPSPYNLGSRTFTGRLAFTCRLVYTSETDTLSIRKTDGTEFEYALTMARDTNVLYDQAAGKALLISTAEVTPANVIATILEEAARLVLSVSGAEVMRFSPPTHVTQAGPPAPGTPTGGPPSTPPAAAAGTPAIFPLPRVVLSNIRAGGVHANAQDGSIVYVADAPYYSDGFYLRKGESWLTQSGVLVSGAAI